jgi:hypothetical protein
MSKENERVNAGHDEVMRVLEAQGGFACSVLVVVNGESRSYFGNVAGAMHFLYCIKTLEGRAHDRDGTGAGKDVSRTADQKEARQ